MENLEEILLLLHEASETSGKDIYIDTEVYNKEGFYIVISESGKIGAFGTVIDDGNEYSEKNVFLVLDDKRIKYLNDEGFGLDDFYKVMGEKLFKKYNLEQFIHEMTS